MITKGPMAQKRGGFPIAILKAHWNWRDPTSPGHVLSILLKTHCRLVICQDRKKNTVTAKERFVLPLL